MVRISNRPSALASLRLSLPGLQPLVLAADGKETAVFCLIHDSQDMSAVTVSV